MTAPQCAGVIHTDFESKFIKAEVVSYDDLIDAEVWLLLEMRKVTIGRKRIFICRWGCRSLQM